MSIDGEQGNSSLPYFKAILSGYLLLNVRPTSFSVNIPGFNVDTLVVGRGAALESVITESGEFVRMTFFELLWLTSAQG